MPGPPSDLPHRVARLEWHVLALTIACIVLAVVAGTALVVGFIGTDAPAATFTAATLHVGYLTAEQVVVKDDAGRPRASLVVGKDGPMLGMFDESGTLIWNAP